MRARVLTQKSEEATASSASLLATPLIMKSGSEHYRGGGGLAEIAHA